MTGERAGMNFLTRLRRNIAGNTVAIVAAALVPLVALIGSGVDMSRAYMVESRLQQACDAGVLAGRKEMGNSTWSTAAANVASEYFEVNYASDYLGSQDVSFVPTNPSGTTTVEGTASVRLPTVIMQFFTFSELNLAVDCAARYDVGNADVTFVLDTTGSMACPSDSNDSQCSGYFSNYGTQEGRSYAGLSTTSRMGALKDAMDSFYNTLDTASAGSGGRIRYSFVPYTGTVNVGRLLPQNYIVDSNAYQSRKSEVTGTTPAEWVVHRTENVCSGWWDCMFNPNAGQNCTSRYYTYHGTSIRGENATTFSGCIWRDYHQGTSTYDTVYRQVTHPTSSYKTFTATLDPTGVTSNRYTWEGCIEERGTVASDSVTFNAGTKTFSPDGLYDLDIDSAPTNDATKWRPYWPEVVFYRNNNTTTASSGRSSQSSCPYQAKLYAEYDSLSAFRTYTNNLAPNGGTYHDIGLLWGARISSPQGIFSSNVNTAPSNNSFVGRHIVFMTDGQLDPGDTYYQAYGVERHDGRITGMQTSTSSTAIVTEQRTRLTRRYKELCKAIKAKGIRLWVVAFNTTLTTDMTECASPNSSYTANNSGALNDAFGQIAEEIADLRLVD
ncbi:MAG: hypothetical protein CL802_08650 [Citromicrobium sp.]|nr:hypothetical protein [Citromicrobium sp.]